MKLLEPRSLAVFAVVALAAAPARADFITGRVVDELGVGVAGVDIDAKNLGGGGDPTLFNDGTDANGFFTTTIPAGTYRITFNPPPPPAASSLILEVEPVVVSGTTAMGAQALPVGVALTGTVLGPTALPVQGVNLDVIELATGTNLDLIADTTDIGGNVSMAVPPGPIEVRFDPAPVIGQTLAPTRLFLDLAADGTFGTLALEQGYVVSALLRGPGGVPLAGADADVTNVATGEELYTPGDNSDSIGFLDFVVPAGTFDVHFCPPIGSTLAGAEALGVVVSANTSVGLINFVAGVLLSGVVRDPGGLPVAGVDLDLNDAVTGLSVPLCRDDTNVSGVYSVRVPTGTYDASFTPPYSEPLGTQEVQGLVVAGATNADGSLPSCAFHTVSGTGTAGTGGLVPTIASSGGSPRLGNPGYTIEVANGVGGATALVVAGFVGPQALPFPGGLAVGSRIGLPRGVITTTLSGAPGMAGVGAASVVFPIPGASSFAGFTLVAKAYVTDPASFSGLAITPGLNAVLCP